MDHHTTWGRVHLTSVLTMLKSRLPINDPSVAMITAMLEIGDQLDSMANRCETCAEETMDVWSRSTAALRTTMRAVAQEERACERLRDRRLSLKLLAALIVATTLIIAAMPRDRNTPCPTPAAPAADQRDVP